MFSFRFLVFIQTFQVSIRGSNNEEVVSQVDFVSAPASNFNQFVFPIILLFIFTLRFLAISSQDLMLFSLCLSERHSFSVVRRKTLYSVCRAHVLFRFQVFCKGLPMLAVCLLCCAKFPPDFTDFCSRPPTSSLCRIHFKYSYTIPHLLLLYHSSCPVPHWYLQVLFAYSFWHKSSRCTSTHPSITLTNLFPNSSPPAMCLVLQALWQMRRACLSLTFISRTFLVFISLALLLPACKIRPMHSLHKCHPPAKYWSYQFQDFLMACFP